MTAFADALTLALMHFVWQGLLVMLALWLALELLRNRPAAARYIASCAAMAVLAILPAATAYLLYAGPAESPGGVAVPAAIAKAVVAAQTPGDTFALTYDAVEKWVLPVWSAGVLILSVRLIWGCRQVSKLRRAGEHAQGSVAAMISGLARRLGVTRRIRAVVSSDAAVPGVVGWLRPVLLLPAATLAGLSSQQLEAVLAHELAHVRRCDYLVNLVQMMIETLLFYHPAVWWTSARIRHERELCCDDLAVAACGDAAGYARALTQLARLRLGANPAIAATGGSLLFRVRRLTGVAAQYGAPSRWPAVLAALAAFACLVLTTDWVQGQQPAAQAPKATPAPKAAAPKPAQAPKPVQRAPSANDSRVRTGDFLEAELAQRMAEIRRAEEDIVRAQADVASRTADIRRAQGDLARAQMSLEQVQLQLERARERQTELQALADQLKVTNDARQLEDLMRTRDAQALMVERMAEVMRLQRQASSGALAGTVTDAERRPVADASVRARNFETGAMYETVTGSDGRYNFGQLQPGGYHLTVIGSGRAPLEREGISVEGGQTVRLDVIFPAR
jgi:beta-lactamase regulating signal transducer with metallopeptidase domain